MSFLRKLSFILFLIGAIGVGVNAPAPAHAATITAVTSGNWNNTATWGGVIPLANDSVVIPSGVVVTIPSGQSVSRSAATSVNGTLYNYGTLTNGSGVTFENNATFNNYAPDGVVNNFGTFDNDGILHNYAWFINQNTGYLTNSSIGAMYNDSGATLDNYYSFYTSNYFVNSSYVRNFSWIANTNGATVTNNGSITNYCGAVYNGTVNGNAVHTLDPASYPSLNTPLHLAHTTDTTPTFTWGTVSNALSYRLFVYLEDHSFEYKKRVFNPSYTLTAGEALAHGKKYLWRVRTQDVYCNTWSGWSGRHTLFID
jgi:hypothetical protein